MKLLSDTLASTAQTLVGFGIAALVLAFAVYPGGSSVVLRILIEFPLLMLLSAILALLINGVAAVCGAVLGGAVWVTALVSMCLGWAVSGGGELSFAGLGYHWLLQPVFAISLVAPWLLKAVTQRT